MGAAITLATLLAAQPATAATDQAPFAAPSPSSEHLREPLAERLLWPTYSWDIVGGRLSVRRGSDFRLLDDSLTADGLAEILGASPRAADLAREAHRDLQWGYALKYGGLLGALAGVVGITIGAAQATDGNAQLAWSTAGGTLLFVGVVSTVLGVVGLNSGFARALDAVNAYNFDLLQGK